MNRNILWGQIFVDELARSGLKAVCAAPGSRHTPLMLAFAKHPDIKVYSHLDERSASFFALGLALASDSPVALVCSSGTAGANMYPAIIEAHQSRVPLIVLTADRPHELRHSGANQTIDQIKMFGDFVLWFVDMALPEANPPAIAIRNLRTTANRAYAKANGLRKGIVHLNFPFRKPLEPTPVEGDMVDVPEDARRKFTYMTELSIADVNTEEALVVADFLMSGYRGVVICGSNASRTVTSDTIAEISKFTEFPIIAEANSGIRFTSDSDVIASYGNFIDINQIEKPKVIFRFGDMPSSKELIIWIHQCNADADILFTKDGVWTDDNHQISLVIQGNMDRFIENLSNKIIEEGKDDDIRAYQDRLKLVDREKLSSHLEKWSNLEKITWQTIDHEIENGAYFDGAVVYDVVDLIPRESTLFAGNSLSVRHLDQFGKPQQKRIYTYANRGASGIDGNISTALGTGAARPDKPLVAILGDITFYHDMNGLLAVHRCGVPITIVLINNDGGGIFNRLPISNFEPEFTDYFTTPHGLDFSHSAKLYGLDYVQIDIRPGQSGTREDFRKIFSQVVGSEKSTIIEVRTDGKFDDARRKEIVASVHAKLKELDL